MNFIFAWLISSIAIFVLEMILMVVGRLIGNFFNFSFDNEISISKINKKILFSVIAGIFLSLI